MRMFKVTPSELKYQVERADHESHFFTRGTMKFFGDTMRNYSVLGPYRIKTNMVETVRAYELRRRRPVKSGYDDLRQRQAHRALHVVAQDAIGTLGNSSLLDLEEEVMKYRVWYRKDPTFLEDKHLYWKDVPKLFAAVKEIEVSELDEVYSLMQAENWSPHGEARELIRGLGLHHTSMSVGDVAENLEDGSFWQCASFGWERF
jgi:hypothetical protein